MSRAEFTSMLNEQYAALGIASVTVRDGGRPVVMKRITCCRCGAHEEGRYAVHLPPEVARKKFSRTGWRVGREPVCPACQAVERERRRSRR